MKILITGGAGRIGRSLRKSFAGRYALIRTLDRLPADASAPGEESMVGDIADMDVMMRAMDGVDGVIHLAGVPYEASIEEMLPTNIVGMWNVYEAARRRGVKRVVFGSSNHAVGFYPRSQRIDNTAPVRPDSRYGLTKCWGEAIGHLYADKHGVRSLHVRIGSFTPLPQNIRALSMWVSERDLAQLCAIGLEHPDIHSDVVFGISENIRAFYDNARAYALGYKPQDRAEDYVREAEAGEQALTHDAVALHYQGGPFCSIEYDGDPIPPRA